MNFIGHHAGTLFHATYYPSIPRRPMQIFDAPIWGVKNSAISIIAYQTDEEREIAALKERVQKLQAQLDTYDRLFRFAGRISKKLICIGQMSDSEIISALKFGIDIRVDNTRYSFRLPVWKIDNHTMVDQEFLRLNGELKDFRDVSCQYPPIEEGLGEDSTITLHKGESLFSENSDASFLDEFGKPMFTNMSLAMTGDFGITDEEESAASESIIVIENVDDTALMEQISRIKSIKSSTSQRLREAIASAKDITRLAAEIAQHVSNANNSRIPLVGTVSEAKGGISETSIGLEQTEPIEVEQTEPSTRPSTKNRTGIPVRVQAPPPQVTSPAPVKQETAKCLDSIVYKSARPTTGTKGGYKDQARSRAKEPASTGPKDQPIAGPSHGKARPTYYQLNTGTKEKRTGAKSCDYVTHAKGKLAPRKTHTPFKYSRPKVVVTKGLAIRRPFDRTLPPSVVTAIRNVVAANAVTAATIPEAFAGIPAVVAEISAPVASGPGPSANNPPGPAPANPNIDPLPTDNQN